MKRQRRSSEERRRLLVLISGGILILAMILGVVIPLLAGLGSGSTNINAEGVFVLEKGKWIKKDLNGSPWIPPDNRTYLVYFKNLECPHCKAFNPTWDEYVKKYSQKDNVIPVIISCTWFTQQCSEPNARASFIAYRVPFTPALLVWHNGTPMYYGPAPQSPQEISQLVKDAIAGKFLNRTQTNNTSP